MKNRPLSDDSHREPTDTKQSQRERLADALAFLVVCQHRRGLGPAEVGVTAEASPTAKSATKTRHMT